MTNLPNIIGINVFGCIFSLTLAFIAWANGQYWMMLIQAVLAGVSFVLLQINLARLKKARRGQ